MVTSSLSYANHLVQIGHATFVITLNGELVYAPIEYVTHENLESCEYEESSKTFFIKVRTPINQLKLFTE